MLWSHSSNEHNTKTQSVSAFLRFQRLLTSPRQMQIGARRDGSSFRDMPAERYQVMYVVGSGSAGASTE